MKLNSGVKPKMKGNTILMVLLFLFSAFSSFASWPAPDTIIIDGEIIYIEKEDVYTDLDSLNAVEKSDVIQKEVRKYPFSAGLYLGFNGTLGSYSTSQSDLQPLDIFMGKPKSFEVNFAAAADISWRWWQFPALNGTIDLAGVTGFGVNKVKVKCSSLVNEEQMALDSIFGLRYDEGQLLIDYFNPSDTIGNVVIGELDTNVVDVKHDVTTFTTYDIPLKLRASWGKQKSSGILFVEAGIVQRIISSKNQEIYDNYVINSSAEYIPLRKSEFNSRNFILPVFAIGGEKKFEFTQGSERQFVSIGGQLSAMLPATAINNGSLFVMQVKTFGLSVFARYYF